MGDNLQLEHNQTNNKSDQSTITILATVDAMGSTDVVSKQTSRGHVSDEENKVEKGGNYL